MTTTNLVRPVASEAVVAYNEARKEYEQMTSNINTSYGSFFNRLDSWATRRAGGRAEILEANIKAVTEGHLAWIARMQELTVVLAELIAAGADVAADEHDTALWRYYEAVREEEQRPIREAREAKERVVAGIRKDLTSRKIRLGLLQNSRVKLYAEGNITLADAKLVEISGTAAAIEVLERHLAEALAA